MERRYIRTKPRSGFGLNELLGRSSHDTGRLGPYPNSISKLSGDDNIKVPRTWPYQQWVSAEAENADGRRISTAPHDTNKQCALMRPNA